MSFQRNDGSTLNHVTCSACGRLIQGPPVIFVDDDWYHTGCYDQ